MLSWDATLELICEGRERSSCAKLRYEASVQTSPAKLICESHTHMRSSATNGTATHGTLLYEALKALCQVLVCFQLRESPREGQGDPGGQEEAKLPPTPQNLWETNENPPQTILKGSLAWIVS